VNAKNFFAELKRRNVYKVAIAYAIVAWLLVQVATSTFPVLEIPNWAIKLVIALVVLGFPVAMVIAWAFELTPEGLKRTESLDVRSTSSRNIGSPGLSRDNRVIYFTFVAAEADIWLLDLGKGG